MCSKSKWLQEWFAFVNHLALIACFISLTSGCIQREKYPPKARLHYPYWSRPCQSNVEISLWLSKCWFMVLRVRWRQKKKVLGKPMIQGYVTKTNGWGVLELGTCTTVEQFFEVCTLYSWNILRLDKCCDGCLHLKT